MAAAGSHTGSVLHEKTGLTEIAMTGGGVMTFLAAGGPTNNLENQFLYEIRRKKMENVLLLEIIRIGSSESMMQRMKHRMMGFMLELLLKLYQNSLGKIWSVGLFFFFFF